MFTPTENSSTNSPVNEMTDKIIDHNLRSVLYMALGLQVVTYR